MLQPSSIPLFYVFELLSFVFAHLVFFLLRRPISFLFSVSLLPFSNFWVSIFNSSLLSASFIPRLLVPPAISLFPLALRLSISHISLSLLSSSRPLPLPSCSPLSLSFFSSLPRLSSLPRSLLLHPSASLLDICAVVCYLFYIHQ